ncbi:MAG TPA: hypothetical protein VKB67_01420 [Rhizomicrobium sp.]|nr:hypothetical protein [Rhizomicrobium sp.]
MMAAWLDFLEGFASASALIAAILSILLLMGHRTHYSVLHYIGQCDAAMREPQFANPELGRLNLSDGTFDGEKREFERYEWYVARLIYVLDAAMCLTPWQQWGAVANTELAGHRQYLASDYFARQNYLAHYSPRMRRLVLNQRAA